MLLKDYLIPRLRVDLPGKAANGEKPHLMIRGLGVDDLTYLISANIREVTDAVEAYQRAKLRGGKMQDFVLLLVRDFPGLCAEVISAAIDQLDDATREVARKLPVATQLQCLLAVLKLTMEEAGSLKNLLAEFQETARSQLSGDHGNPTPPKI